jgi:single-strand selective monofunctional uracil DNA glycosylase
VGVAERVHAATTALRRDVAPLRFSKPVTHVYNPLDYAARSHLCYIRRFATTRKRVVFLGMNPGPFGMAQTGVPFGEVSHVRDWLGIEEPVRTPAHQHPKRPVQGFACERREVSGERLWGAIAQHWSTPERFFEHHYIANYCPLVFMEESGRNRTPDKLPAAEREALYRVCDRHLRRLVKVLEPTWLIGIGSFATSRAQAALGEGVQIATVLHPSPASPRANRGWARQARRELRAAGICKA